MTTQLRTPHQLTWSTEQPSPDSLDLDTRSSLDIVATITSADAQVARAVAAVNEQIAAAADLMVGTLAGQHVVHYVGSGTSGRMGVLDAVELWPTFRIGADQVQAHLAGGMAAMAMAAEGAEDDVDAGRQLAVQAGVGDLFIGLAASGRTPYVGGALSTARERGLPTVLISVNPQAPLAQYADVAILPDTGSEVLTGSTRMKAATAQKMILNAISTAAMVRLGKVYSNLMIDMIPTNAKLQARSVRMLQQASGVNAEQATQMLAAADGNVRVALVALVAQTSAAQAAAAVAAHPADPDRAGDPSGLRSAIKALLGTDTATRAS